MKLEIFIILIVINKILDIFTENKKLVFKNISLINVKIINIKNNKN